MQPNRLICKVLRTHTYSTEDRRLQKEASKQAGKQRVIDDRRVLGLRGKDNSKTLCLGVRSTASAVAVAGAWTPRTSRTGSQAGRPRRSSAIVKTPYRRVRSVNRAHKLIRSTPVLHQCLQTSQSDSTTQPDTDTGTHLKHCAIKTSSSLFYFQAALPWNRLSLPEQ